MSDATDRPTRAEADRLLDQLEDEIEAAAVTGRRPKGVAIVRRWAAPIVAAEVERHRAIAAKAGPLAEACRGALAEVQWLCDKHHPDCEADNCESVAALESLRAALAAFEAGGRGAPKMEGGDDV
jgi:hypothetical protein